MQAREGVEAAIDEKSTNESLRNGLFDTYCRSDVEVKFAGMFELQRS